jgi:regulator of cell morphogenesis and NO signaling
MEVSEMNRAVTDAGSLMTTMTVNEAIATWPRTVAVFNRFGIDACCGGAVPIAKAAERDGADLGALTAELGRVLEEGA